MTVSTISSLLICAFVSSCYLIAPTSTGSFSLSLSIVLRPSSCELIPLPPPPLSLPRFSHPSLPPWAYYDVFFPHQTVYVSRRYKEWLKVILNLTRGTQNDSLKAYVEALRRLVLACLCFRCYPTYINSGSPLFPLPLHTHTNPTKASDPSSPILQP